MSEGEQGWKPREARRQYHLRRAREGLEEGRRAFAQWQARQEHRHTERRVLVTGSRDWTDWKTVGDALNAAGPTVVVHGACYPSVDQETGKLPWRSADWLAHLWCRRHGIPDEPHPADWARLGRGAGPRRNEEMVAAGADVCLAFILDNSRGASGCADLAEAAGIPTFRYRAASVTPERMTS